MGALDTIARARSRNRQTQQEQDPLKPLLVQAPQNSMDFMSPRRGLVGPGMKGEEEERHFRQRMMENAVPPVWARPDDDDDPLSPRHELGEEGSPDIPSQATMELYKRSKPFVRGQLEKKFGAEAFKDRGPDYITLPRSRPTPDDVPEEKWPDTGKGFEQLFGRPPSTDQEVEHFAQGNRHFDTSCRIQRSHRKARPARRAEPSQRRLSNSWPSQNRPSLICASAQRRCPRARLFVL